MSIVQYNQQLQMGKQTERAKSFWLVVLLSCACVLSNSQGTFPQTIKGTLTNANPSTSVTLLVDDGNPESKYLTFNYQPDANNPAIVASYMQVVLGESPLPKPINVTDMKNRNIDVYGYSMLKDQLVVLEKPGVPTNITITIRATHNPTGNYSLDYSLVSGLALLKPCPSACSNQGTCQPEGTCQCNTGFAGYDCSVMPVEISSTRYEDRNLTYKHPVYYKILCPELTTVYQLFVDLLTPESKVGAYAFFQDQSDTNMLPSIVYYRYTMTMSYMDRYFAWELTSNPNNLWVVLMPLVNVTTNIQTDMSISTYSISENAFVIFCIVMIGCIFMSMICFMKRVPPPTTNRRISSSNRLTLDEIENYFPDAPYKHLYMDRKANGEEAHECVICLCTIEDNEKVKLTYCNHVFHSNCLTSWFKIEQTCPYCRACFDKKKTLELYKEINLFYQSSNPGQNIKLKSEDIPQSIIALQKSRKKCGDKDLIIPPLQEPQDQKDTEFRQESDWRLNLKQKG